MLGQCIVESLAAVFLHTPLLSLRFSPAIRRANPAVKANSRKRVQTPPTRPTCKYGEFHKERQTGQAPGDFCRLKTCPTTPRRKTKTNFHFSQMDSEAGAWGCGARRNSTKAVPRAHAKRPPKRGPIGLSYPVGLPPPNSGKGIMQCVILASIIKVCIPGPPGPKC